MFIGLLLLQVIGGVVGIAPQRPGSQPAVAVQNLKPATIRGKVTAADTGAPLRRAMVTLRRQGPGMGPNQDTISAATDGAGLYEIRNIEPGTYSASCNKTGFVNTSYKKSKTSQGDSIVLPEGQEVREIDFLMPRSGVITGRVTDDEGEPVADATVSSLTKRYNGGRVQFQPSKSVQTDDRGIYRLHDLPAGRYYIQACKRSNSGQGMPHYAPSIFPNATRLANAQTVAVVGGTEVSGINLTLREAVVYSVSGKIIDMRTGQPAGYAFLNANSDDFGAGTSANARTNPDGTFRMNEMAPGRYRIYVSIPDATGKSQGFTRFVEVTNANVADLVFNGGAGATIKGQLRADGGTLSKMHIQMMERNPDGRIYNALSGESDADGNFEIPGAQPGNYELNLFPAANMPGMAGPGTSMNPSINKPFFIRDITVSRQNVGEGPIPVPEGATVVEVSVTLDFRPGTLTGKVLDAEGNPLPATSVVLLSADPKKRGMDRYLKMGRTRPDGTFNMMGVIPGDYYLVAWPNNEYGQVQDPDLFLQLEKYLTRVTVTSAETSSKDVRLSPEVRTIADAFSQ